MSKQEPPLFYFGKRGGTWRHTRVKDGETLEEAAARLPDEDPIPPMWPGMGNQKSMLSAIISPKERKNL